jgi:hypothetical protein
MKSINLWELKRKAKAYYPQAVSMQRQWLRQSVNLYATGRHAFLTGGWKHGSH